MDELKDKLEKMGQVLHDEKKQPIFFIGSGLSKRYLDTPNWEGLLTQIAEKVACDYKTIAESCNEEYYRNIAGGVEIFQLTQKHIRRLYQANIVNAPNLLVSIGNKICLGPYETFKDAELDYHKIATQYVHAALWLEKTDKAIRLVTE